MLGRIRGAVRFKEPLSYHTSLRIGGPAEFFIAPQDLDDIRHALLFAHQEDLPVVVVGGGNNILVSDRGLQAVVLKLQGVLSRSQFDGTEAVVGAGVPLPALIRETMSLGLGGLEPLAGIPATVGGALVMNAHTQDGGLRDLCSEVYFLYPDGTLGEMRPSSPDAFQQLTRSAAILVGCRLRLTRRLQSEIHRDIQQRMKLKIATQPLTLASAGYIWKNPRSESAARLVESSGLRGKRVNGAEISAKCGNFILNRGGATAADVLALMDMMSEVVERRFEITLQPEIRTLGFDAARTEAERSELVAAR